MNSGSEKDRTAATERPSVRPGNGAASSDPLGCPWNLGCRKDAGTRELYTPSTVQKKGCCPTNDYLILLVRSLADGALEKGGRGLDAATAILIRTLKCLILHGHLEHAEQLAASTVVAACIAEWKRCRGHSPTSEMYLEGLSAMALRRFEEAENLFTALLRHHHDAMQWANKAHCEAIRKLRAEEEQQ